MCFYIAFVGLHFLREMPRWWQRRVIGGAREELYNPLYRPRTANPGVLIVPPLVVLSLTAVAIYFVIL